MNTAVEQSTATGVIFVASAGNGVGSSQIGVDAAGVSPASAPGAITVGATTQSDQRASFSNFGACVDLFAPCVGITSDWLGSASSTTALSGTSMPAPHVTGAVARYLQDHATAGAAQVGAALVAPASPGISDPGPGSPNRLLFAAATGGAAGSSVS